MNNNIEIYLIDDGFIHYQDFVYNDLILSRAYVKDDMMIILDYDSIFESRFSYKRYCQKQNEWMSSHAKVYRFVIDDYEFIKQFFEIIKEEFGSRRTFNRELNSVDPSPLEKYFEDCFEVAYGHDSYKYLLREFSFIMHNGKIGYLDYVLQRKDGSWIAIEENGISYHHPYIIKKEKYRSILMKQNSVVEQNGLVFRWDSESIRDSNKMADEILEFVGDISQYLVQTSYSTTRKFKLYDHQKEVVSSLRLSRIRGVRSALVVLPVGTGKTVVAIEDLKIFLNECQKSRVLILVPTIDLRVQWTKVIAESGLGGYEIFVKTYYKEAKDYFQYSSNEYDYIVVDEAHHAVAPVMRKVLRHYDPKYLLGLTATDKRLDEKKLEDVFGNYDTKLDLKEAIEKGILSPIRAYRLETSVDISKVRFNGNDYVNSDIEKTITIPSRNEAIVVVLKEYFMDRLKGKSGIVFCVSVSHAKQMAKLMLEKGFKAASVDGKDKKRPDKIRDYMEGKIQFLCTCSLLTEGWDAPRTSVIVMARPTMSKVLYTQQLGRGTRNYPGKEALYVIDIVDDYGASGCSSLRPWSVHSIFDCNTYIPFGDVVNVGGSKSELVILDTIHEVPVKLAPTDIFTFEKQYEDYFSEEQLARELFVSTGTVKSWIRNGSIKPDLVLPFGNRSLRYFAPNSIQLIREAKGLREHNEDTIVEDFWDFINIGDYTFSYKMYFILSLLDNVNETGDADFNDVLNSYINYYRKRHDDNMIIDRSNSPYNNLEHIMDKKKMKNSMLNNPFEKFERKRFLYHNSQKDLSLISFHHKIWEELNDNNGKERLKR